MDTALVISLLALLFTVFSFWWINARRGRLRVFPPRSYAAFGSETAKLVVDLPLLFFNDGPAPYCVTNLRLCFEGEKGVRALTFVATKGKLGTDQDRTFATQFPVRGRDALLLIREFQREPGGLVFEVGSYPMRLEAQLQASTKWRPLARFPLRVNPKGASVINTQFLVHDNLGDD